MGLKTAFRNWANRPTKLEKALLLQQEQFEKQQSDQQEQFENAQRLQDEQVKARLLEQSGRESAQVRSLKKQIEVLEELLEKSYEQIRSQSEIIASHRDGDWMDKLIDKGLDVVDNLFGSSKSKKVIDVTPTLQQSVSSEEESTENAVIETSLDETSEGYTFQQISEIVNALSPEDLKKASSVPFFLLKQGILDNYPGATDENIKEAQRLIKEKVQNGE